MPTAITQSGSNDAADLVGELRAHHAALLRISAPDDPIVRLLEAALASRDSRTLRAAKAACDALPPEEQRHLRVINEERPSRADLLRDYADKSVRRFFQVDCWDWNDLEDTEPEDGHVLTSRMTWELRRTSCPVRVLIHEGSAKAKVLTMLARVLEDLARNWDRLVTFDEPLPPPPDAPF